MFLRWVRAQPEWRATPAAFALEASRFRPITKPATSRGRPRPTRRRRPVAAARSPSGMVNRTGVVGHFGSQFAMQIGHEVLARRIAAQPRGTQLVSRSSSARLRSRRGAHVRWTCPRSKNPPQSGRTVRSLTIVTSSPDCCRHAQRPGTATPLRFATVTPI